MKKSILNLFFVFLTMLVLSPLSWAENVKDKQIKLNTKYLKGEWQTTSITKNSIPLQGFLFSFTFLNEKEGIFLVVQGDNSLPGINFNYQVNEQSDQVNLIPIQDETALTAIIKQGLESINLGFLMENLPFTVKNITQTTLELETSFQDENGEKVIVSLNLKRK